MKIETQAGYFGLDNPCPPIDIIAHSLGNLCRFTGHSSMFYSVADHSVLVSRLTSWLGGDPMNGLLHDAHECLVGDMASPVKSGFPEFKRLESVLSTGLLRGFGRVALFEHETKRADMIAVFMEAEHFLPSRGLGWEGREKYVDDLTKAKEAGIILPDDVFRYPHDGATRFLERFQWLTRH